MPRASTPLAGRSFPVYESVHERENCPKYQNRLLKSLVELLPDNCVAILVTGAVFRRPWMKAVAAQGWYYVARIRNSELYRRDETDWQPVKNLYALTAASPKALGRVEMTRSAPLHRLVLRTALRQGPQTPKRYGVNCKKQTESTVRQTRA